ncbi:MAG TPA: hypothetical protein VNC19_06375, partial [Gemmatimonadales bacterium]|nr:hypothetical protein [Gemmatimonadales bacterium]
MDHTSKPAEEMRWPRSLAVEKFEGYSVTHGGSASARHPRTQSSRFVEVCSLRILIGAQRNNVRIRPWV